MLYRIQHGLVDIQPDSYLQKSDRRTSGEHKNSKLDLQFFLLPKNNQGLEHATIWDNNIADTGGIKGKPYCLPPSVQLLDCKLSMYIVLTSLKKYIYIEPLTIDTREHVSAAGLVLTITQSFTQEEEEEKNI